MSEPRSSTECLIQALAILSRVVHSEDGIANSAIAEASQRLKELQSQLAGIVKAFEPFAEALEVNQTSTLQMDARNPGRVLFALSGEYTGRKQITLGDLQTLQQAMKRE